MSLEYVFILTCYCKSEAHTMRFQPVKLIRYLYRLQAVIHACMKAHAIVHYMLGIYIQCAPGNCNNQCGEWQILLYKRILSAVLV